MNNRMAYVDRIKGLAILLVIMGHLIAISFVNANGNPLFSICETSEMFLFSFISGYVINPSSSSKKLYKKLCSFLCPMLIIGLLYATYCKSSYEEFFASSFKKGYWYFLFLAYCHIIMWFVSCCKIYTKKRKINFIIDIFILVIVFLMARLAKSILGVSWNSPDYLSLNILFVYWPFFYLGHISRKYNLLSILNKFNWISAASIILYIPFVYLYTKNGYIYMFIAATFAIMSSCYFFYKREKSTTKFEKVLEYFGYNSLYIYLFHFFFVSSIHLDECGKWFSDTGNFLLETLLVCFAAVCISLGCILISKIIRINPIINKIIFGRFLDNII